MRHRSSLRAIRPRAEALSRCCLGLVAIAALATACNPFVHKAAPQYPKDPRFSEFVFDFNEEPKIQTRVDSLNLRWPGLAASEAHITVEYSRSGFGIPQTEPEFWITAVATVPDKTITQLVDNNIGDTSLLPGIYPGLYEYVPQDCQFTTINPEFADKALAPDKSSIPDDFGPMDIEALAMSEDCHLLVFTALGHS